MGQDVKLDLKGQIENLPDATGVYLFKDSRGTIIYIGKARSVRNRVRSHFNPGGGELNQSLLPKSISDIDYILTESEIEAVLLEADLIKKYLPRFNVRIKDDKSFPYILITDEEYPRIIVKRTRKENELAAYKHVFGPFINVKAITRTLNFLFKIFPVCSCAKPRKKRVRPCLKYQLKMCPAPCCEKTERTEYLNNLNNIVLFLEGRKKEMIETFKLQMKGAAERLEYETAANLRDLITALEKTIINQRVISTEADISLGTIELQEVLELPQKPERIEAFDISNLSGTDPTGSMVLFIGGKPMKSGYRRFKIRSVDGANDVAMMGEVLERRYRRMKNEKLIPPDLIIVDGGKPQLNIATKILTNLGLKMPVIGLAKKFEHIFKPNTSEPIIISGDSPALFLLQRIRDEAHRFALRYHQLLRKKRIISQEKSK